MKGKINYSLQLNSSYNMHDIKYQNGSTIFDIIEKNTERLKLTTEEKIQITELILS